jgi:hypothetical protein
LRTSIPLNGGWDAIPYNVRYLTHENMHIQFCLSSINSLYTTDEVPSIISFSLDASAIRIVLSSKDFRISQGRFFVGVTDFVRLAKRITYTWCRLRTFHCLSVKEPSILSKTHPRNQPEHRETARRPTKGIKDYRHTKPGYLPNTHHTQDE